MGKNVEKVRSGNEVSSLITLVAAGPRDGGLYNLGREPQFWWPASRGK